MTRGAWLGALGVALVALPWIAGVAEWIVTAALSGGVGLVIGAASIPLAGFVIAPAWKLVKSVFRRRERTA